MAQALKPLPIASFLFDRICCPDRINRYQIFQQYKVTDSHRTQNMRKGTCKNIDENIVSGDPTRCEYHSVEQLHCHRTKTLITGDYLPDDIRQKGEIQISFALTHWIYLPSDPTHPPEWRKESELAFQLLMPQIVVNSLLVAIA